MGKKVVYISLDERNCNYGFPYQLGKIAGLDIVRPPIEIMSKIKEPCDFDKMWEWLTENIKDCSYAVLSLDMLVYGSLMNSRRHTLSEDECISRLNRLRQLKEINPAIEIHAFILIMRTSNYDNNSEEPDYWDKFGKKIWRLSWLSDKKIREKLDPNERIEIDELKNSIPQEYINDYTGRRKKNLQVNLEALRLVRENIIDHFVIPKDDNSEFGYSTQDQDSVYRQIIEYGIRSRVYIYPGADEVGCTLVSRILNKIHDCVPKIYVNYSSTLGSNIVAKYEDRPINESVKWQIMSSGAMLVDNYENADIILMVNTPGKYMIECSEQFKRDYSYNNFRNLDEFIQKMKYYISLGKRCIVADIAYPNGADNELVEMLKNEHLLNKIFAYGGWNTAANTLGVVILQGTVAFISGVGNIAEVPELFKFHIEKIVEDWAYQANVLLYFGNVRSKELGYDCYKVGDFKETICGEIVVKLNKFLEENLLKEFPASNIVVKDVGLAWNRLYDVEFNLELS